MSHKSHLVGGRSALFFCLAVFLLVGMPAQVCFSNDVVVTITEPANWPQFTAWSDDENGGAGASSSIEVTAEGIPTGGSYEWFGDFQFSNPHAATTSVTPNRPASRTLTVKYTVPEEGSDQTSKTVHCVYADIDIFEGHDGLSEWTQGGWTPLDVDDDNGNGQPDYQDDSFAGMPAGGPQCADMHNVRLEITPNNLGGTANLHVLGGSGEVFLYHAPPDFGPPVNISLPYTPAPDGILGQLLLQGRETGEARLEFTYTPPGSDVTATDRVMINVWSVSDVVWQEIHQGNVDSDIEPQPGGTPGGGDRIFPGKTGPTDTKNRRRLRVRAEVTPAKQGLFVYFKNLDVDDPSANTSPIDNESEEEDNRGGAGTLYGQQAQTDGQGGAQTEFQVGWQPGDNYRIFAHGLVSFSDGFTGVFDVEAKQDDGTQARLRYRRGAKQFVNAAFYTGLLTVWRKLHVERDSMGEPPAAHVFGIETGTSTNLTPEFLTDNTKNWPLADLEGGLLDPNTDDGIPEAFEVDWNSNTIIGIVGQGLTGNAQTGDPYSVDTDDVDLGDLPTPDCAVLQSALLPCYADVAFDTGEEDGNVEWLRYAGSLGGLGDTWRGSKTWEAQDFWCAYILSAYEGLVNEDQDPESEFAHYGITTTTGEPEYSAVLLEVLRDGGYGEAAKRQTTAHEVGHQFQLNLNDDDNHPQTCIMHPFPTAATSFCDDCKASIRGVGSP